MSGSSTNFSGTITNAAVLQNATLAAPGPVIITGSVLALGQDALYANGAVVNQGALGLGGPGTDLTIIIDNGPTAAYNLTIPSLVNLNTIAISQAATLNITGTELSNQADININAGTLIVSGGAVDGGQVTAPASSTFGDPNLALSILGAAPITLPPPTSATAPPGGTIALTGGGLAWFGAGIANQTILFTGDGTVYFGAPDEVNNVTIAGFGPGDTITSDNAADAALLASKLIFASPQAAVAVADVPPCFARGTRLLTPLGYVPVETLKPGDPVITALGDTRAVRWLGCCTVDICTHSRPEAVHPIRFTPGALAPGIPAQALRLSPDHGLYLNGVLVPAKLLVNGATIIRETGTPAITYYHVELNRHDILLAEGMAVESYLDTGNRKNFTREQGNPVFGRSKKWDTAAYAPLCQSGPGLQTIRQAIRARTAALGYKRRTLTEVTLLAGGQRIIRYAGTTPAPIFQLPAPFSGEITIQSANFIPAELAQGEADEDDNRILGIALTEITLGGRPFAPRQLARAGFYPRAANDRADWTDGRGVIHVAWPVTQLGLSIAALPLGWTKQ
jgi:hypothetical protein